MKIAEMWNKYIEPAGDFVGNFVPYVGTAVKAINAFMPEGEQLPENATKDQMKAAVDSLPADQRAALMSKDIDLKITEVKEWSHVVDSLAKADATGNTTRPSIADRMAWLVVFEVVILMAVIFVAVWRKDTATLTIISDSWELVLTAMATPTALLRAYFGMRTEEKKARYAASNGKDHQSGIAGVLGSLFNKK